MTDAPDMYALMIAQCVQTLRNLERWIDKAEQYAAAKGFDPDVLVASRLAPDMRPFSYQVQSACDHVKGAAAWLSGATPPTHEDTERTFAELRERIHKTLAFVDGIPAADYADAGERKISFSWAPGKVIGGRDYLLQMIVPNAYFHLTTAYAILRHNGVDLGKMDFLQPVNLVDA